ncbi:putative D,D-dipeptide transport ATP-binding protein DdpF [Ensifer sp. M14]|jgi:peptide/nickel transport system ATP-binding protein|uniref:ABC transporter ATP-binding protein n=1 Tax=Sinorhizobium/Ensifer group TaxID=227292 RepID=UPI000984D9A2|nr:MULTISPECIES: oligopeptide/dipeptide ABC transporter ATP-binding protein [Sinorhizobium/Ensifer group]OOG74990.1 peptide ABC transporter ATP-binding protein [Sinorhizobium sp. A49]RDL46575.1 putative D,D-dipeptide transport ATP-binding protein DdpF [Ensifer sp. M14]
MTERVHTITRPVLEVSDLNVRFPASRDWLGRPTSHVHAVNGVTLQVRGGRSLGIVGESGCGKSTLAQAIIGLAPYEQGRVAIDGQDFQTAQGRQKRDLRQKMQIVFQDPQSSLDRRLPVWRLISEPLHIRGGHSNAELHAKAEQLAAAVGLRPEHLDRLPHEFSGGQRQRIAIARAISTDPDLLVLDEPTSALDVSVQAQIVNLLLKLQRERGLTYLLISHDVALVRHFCDDVAVMYLGQIVESGPADEVLGNPRHPYTQTLLASAPSFETPLPTLAELRIGELPNNRKLPTGCFYRERCAKAVAGCEAPQVLQRLGDGRRQARCHLAQG